MSLCPHQAMVRNSFTGKRSHKNITGLVTDLYVPDLLDSVIGEESFRLGLVTNGSTLCDFQHLKRK